MARIVKQLWIWRKMAFILSVLFMKSKDGTMTEQQRFAVLS
jgi:hypothetical protein